jgi:type IV secretion system protein VirB11
MRSACADFMRQLEDPMVTEIMANPDGVIWQDKAGEGMSRIGTISPENARYIVNLTASVLDKEVNYLSPILEGEFLIGNYRFAGQLPPIVAAPTFTIRKPATRIFTLDEYVANNIMTAEQASTIIKAVTEHKNILIIGGTASGKTTLLNSVLNEMTRQFPKERFLIAEDTHEIQCSAENIVAYHTVSGVDFSIILKTELRMRPDRLIFGEVRDHAALDLLDSWNTGHHGGCSTLHANENTAEGLSRLASLVSRNHFAPKNIDALIASAVEFIIFIKKTNSGRKVTSISRKSDKKINGLIYEEI